ncbi:MAG: hypothetical protein AAB518_03080 [Patescibacteria group bacterium]
MARLKQLGKSVNDRREMDANYLVFLDVVRNITTETGIAVTRFSCINAARLSSQQHIQLAGLEEQLHGSIMRLQSLRDSLGRLRTPSLGDAFRARHVNGRVKRKS